MIHVALSAKEAPFTQTERVMVQVAQPLLRSDAYWNVDPSLVALAQAGQPPVRFEVEAQFQPTSGSGLRPDSLESKGVQSLDVLHFHGASFQKVADISEYTIGEAAGSLACADSVGEEYTEALRDISLYGDDPGAGCYAGFDLMLCGKMSSTRLRALCPNMCACYDGFLSWSGLFGTSAFGCPTECLKYPAGTIDRLSGDRFPCEDTGPGNFSAVTGYLPNLYHYWNRALDSHPEQINLSFRDFYTHYVGGLQEYVSSDPSMREGVPNSIGILFTFRRDLASLLDFNALVRHVVGGAFFEELAAGNWTIFPGVPHPSGLTGCDFLASAEIAFLIRGSTWTCAQWGRSPPSGHGALACVAAHRACPSVRALASSPPSPPSLPFLP
ncbi:unnamed protein product, partial [Prorocentrum cordatum]